MSKCKSEELEEVEKQADVAATELQAEAQMKEVPTDDELAW